MAKIRMPEKVESKSTSLQSRHFSDKCKYSKSTDKSFDDLDDMIDGVQSIQIFKSIITNNKNLTKMIEKSQNNQPILDSNLIFKKNNITSDDEKSEKLSDEEDEDDDEGLIERGPLKPQIQSMNRSTPYTETFYWSSSNIVQQSDNSTDFDTSAKEILTDCEHRKKIDFCLDKLSDMNQGRSITNLFSPTYSNFIGVADNSKPPQQQQQWQSNRSLGDLHTRDSCYVPSISICESETSLLKILSRGGFQPTQSSSTSEHNRTGSVASSSQAWASNGWPNFSANSNNACAISSSRFNSRASSRTQSPTCSNGCSGASFFNALGSPMGSPQVSPQNFQNRQRPSSCSSSNRSYCETPSPANYQTPLDQHLEDQLGDHVMTRLPTWHENFNSSDTFVDSVDSSELQLQLIEEVIRGDMNSHIKEHPNSDLDLQVVPNCKSILSSNFSNIYSIMNNNQQLSSSASTYIDTSETTDDLTNTLLRFVQGEQAIVSPKKLEARSSSTTSDYSSSSSSSSCCSEVRKTCDGSFLQIGQMSNYLETSKSLSSQLPQQQTVYQQHCTNLNSTINVEDLQYTTATVHLNGRNSWQSEPNSLMATSSSINNFSDFQIPETVLSYNSQIIKSSSKSISNNGSNGKYNIAPWPSLNLPSTRASERLKEVTDPLEVEKAMKNLLKRPLHELTKGDEDGDTMLMCLAGNPLELRKKLAYLAPLVERLGTIDGALSSLNLRGEDALYLAAINCPQMSFVAGYLAAAFLQKNIDIGQRLYRSRGDTLVHALADKGDEHGEVLAELLSLKTAQGNLVFDLSKRNYDGRTALHIAAESHNSMRRSRKIVSIGTIRLLLENGADPTVREVRCGDTALHLAISSNCDPSMVKILLTGRGHQGINVANYNGNTPLHIAAMISERASLERQLEICWILIQAGARTNITNRQGKTPLALISADRKEALRRIFHKKI